MSTDPNSIPASTQAWNSFAAAFVAGTFDTRIKTGEDYASRTLAEIFQMKPAAEDKLAGPAFIPSTYADYDAREHGAQRERGQFIALTADIDSGDLGPGVVQQAIDAFVGESAYLIYSSPHSRPGDRRWRALIPLAVPVPFDAWYDAQTALFTFLGSKGIETDWALARAGQLVFLPNVPAVHEKTGTALRGEDGKPLHYQRHATSLAKPGLDLSDGPVSDGMAEIRRRRAEDERERDRMRKEAEQRRANRPQGTETSLIEDFNAANSVETMLELCGYTQSDRDARDWQSPYQTGSTFATRIMDDKWFSLSQSDVSARVGQTCRDGCFGDAYDLYAHYKHGGDHKAAYRTLGQEQRASNVIHPARFNPPEWMDEAPPYDELPEWAGHDEFVIDEPAAPVAEELRVVDAFDFLESEIPTRPWVIPGVMLSGYTHMLAAPGGSGKSLFTLQLAIALARGEPWGDFIPRHKARTLVINVEDDLHEQRRRLAAAQRVMEADRADLMGMVHLVADTDSIVIAGFDNARRMVATPIVHVIVDYIRRHAIDVLIVDPFTETFEGDENDNSEVKWAMRVWRDEIARATGCVVYLVHHTTKGASAKAGEADVVRGAGAIVNSTRISATLMPMTSDEAEAVGIDAKNRHLYVRYDDAKANQSLKSGHARWFEKITVQLANGTEEHPGDEVGALKPWRLPSPFDGITTTHLKRVQTAIGGGQWRENQQANEWAGNAVADALMMNANDPKDRKRIIAMLREWIKNDVLRVVENEDAKRNKRKFVEVGIWVTD